MANKPNAASTTLAMTELGVAGGSAEYSNTRTDEFAIQLRGDRGVKKYREMKDNDPTIGSVLHAMDMVLRGVPWRVEPSDGHDPAAVDEALFVETVFGDMSHTFEDFISDALSFLPFGFSFHETVFKRRGGYSKDPTQNSKYTDGRIGLRKLAPRPQWTLDRFTMDKDGGIQAFIQNTTRGNVTIPMDKGLLFRTTSANNNPRGRSVLRNSFVPYFYLSHVQQMEAIAIERELNGLPLGRMPSEYLGADATPAQAAIKNRMVEILRDTKLNTQGYVLLPSDFYRDAEGKPTQHRLIDFELISAKGTRAIDTGAVATRYKQDIARTVLADFILLGQSSAGSFALSKSKTQLFLQALEGYLNGLAAVLNRFLLPRLWRLNGLAPALMPTMVPGKVAPEDIAELAEFISKLAGAGARLFPDDALENDLRGAAGLPELPDDADALLATGAGDEDPEE